MKVTNNISGTTLEVVDGEFIVADHPEAPEEMRNAEIGRIAEKDGVLAYQPSIFCPWGLTAETLRSLANLLVDKDKLDKRDLGPEE